MKLKYFFSISIWSVLIVFILYQAILPASLASAKDGLDKATIAGIEISDAKKSEIQSLLANEVSKWKQNDIIIQGTTAKIVIPSDYIKFDINKTVDNYITDTSSSWYNFWGGNKKVEVPIEIIVDEKVKELLQEAPLFYVDETLEALKEHARYLIEGEVQAAEVELSKDILDRISFEIQDVTVDGSGISYILDALNETIILHDENFSFLEMLEDVNSVYPDETANFVASTLYSAVLQSELEIKERHSQHVRPVYLQPGIEVSVDSDRALDFSFINRTNKPVIISSAIKEGRLVIELYSFKSDYEITYEVKNKENVEPRIIYRLSSELPIGQEKVIEEGKDGFRIQVYKKINEIGGSFGDEKLISKDFYPPVNKVVLVSSLEPVTDSSNENETGTGTGDTSTPDEMDDTERDDSLKPGELEEDSITDDSGNNEPEGSYYDKGGNLITPDSK